MDVLKLRDPVDLRNVQRIQRLQIMSICHLAHRIIRKVNISYQHLPGDSRELQSEEPHHPNVQNVQQTFPHMDRRTTENRHRLSEPRPQ